MQERFKMIASGYAFFIRDNTILLSRRYKTGYEDGKYSLPAGHIEDNETIAEGTCREVQEEVGVILKPSDMQLVHVMHRKEADIRMDFFFVIKKWKQEPKNMEPEKCDDLAWFPFDNLPKNTVGYIRFAIAQYRKHIFYSEIGWK